MIKDARIFPMPTARKKSEATSVNSTSLKFQARSATFAGPCEPPLPPANEAAVELANETDVAEYKEVESSPAIVALELIEGTRKTKLDKDSAGKV